MLGGPPSLWTATPQSFLLFKKKLLEKTDGGIPRWTSTCQSAGQQASMLERVCDGTIQGVSWGQLEIVPKMLVFSLPFCGQQQNARRQAAGKLCCQGKPAWIP